MEVLQRHPGGDDVRVISGRNGDEGVRVSDPRVLEQLAVETESHHLAGALAGGVAPERLRVLVDDGHVVSALEQGERKLGADPPAADDQCLQFHGPNGTP